MIAVTKMFTRPAHRMAVRFILLSILSCLLPYGRSAVLAQSNDDCMTCHEDPELKSESDGLGRSLYVDGEKFSKSTHADLKCVSCHTYLEGVEDFPHEMKHEPVVCGDCHDDIAKQYNQSLHGVASAAGVKLAPHCWDCHSKHDIRSAAQPGSQVARFNIPFMCGGCHKEGTEVSRTYDNILPDSILSHYSESIHGEGLYKRGLTVTAVCTDCHTAHFVLPHTDIRSSINRNNVAATCQKCHGQIERVHQKVIRGELWEKEPNKVPICVDCHEPHRVRRIYYDQISDQECMKCHAKPGLKMNRQGKEISLFVDSIETRNSIHQGTTCAQCHTGVTPRAHRPCETVSAKVDCGICHTEIVETFATCTHGRLVDRGDPDAPECIDCHGVHNVKTRRNPSSPTFPTNVPSLCGSCHIGVGVAATRRIRRGELVDPGEYPESIHGKGLLESGLVVTAMCTDCHTAHHVLPKDDPASSINAKNIPQTCARCHNGIYEKFVKSIHSASVSKSTDSLPSCASCHQSHSITRTDTEGFKQRILGQCGGCHAELTKTYFETFHGKVFQLGGLSAAECHDCHGSHDILPPDNPASHLSRQNIVGTCGKCHKGSHRQFAGYLTHATHHDKGKFPALFYTFWFMTFLLVGTLMIATTHTLLWLPRSIQTMRQKKSAQGLMRKKLVYRRFTKEQSIQHGLMVVSFLGLAVTGMTLKFSYLSWAKWLSSALGGFESAGYIHRVCAVLTGVYFSWHLVGLIRSKIRTRIPWMKFLFSPDSMLPNKNDLKELGQTFKWFIGMGPRPRYGRWTYWEKFDYFAVFWGVAIIGTTGLVLWFPEFFTLVLPGRFVNVATIIHSDEALLAAAFIFTVHFFNTHFRPDKFPMDITIFTGRESLVELKADRPREYQRLVDEGKLSRHLDEPLPEVTTRLLKIFGAVALIIGVILIGLIIYAEIFGYK